MPPPGEAGAEAGTGATFPTGDSPPAGPPMSPAEAINTANAPSRGGAMKRLTVEGGKEGYYRGLLVAAPAYPRGIGGRLRASGSPEGATANKHGRYSMTFDSTGPDGPRGAAPAARGTGRELPAGLEAVRDEKDGMSNVLYVREIGDSGPSDGTSAAAAVAEGGRLVIARIEATTPAVKDGREAAYSVVLLDEDGGGGGELMAVRVTTQPTGLAVPREVRAVLLLPPPPGEDGGTGGAGRGDEESGRRSG